MPPAGENTAVVVRRARQEDFEMIADLLQGSSLPTLGVNEHLDTFLVAEEGGKVIGAIGLEVYDKTALLRSAVVAPGRRSAGIGSRLYDQLLRFARELGVRRLVLLTNTAEEYFRRKGFKTVHPESITGPVRTSVEFTGACPSHAVCMACDVPVFL
jgi:amino-acid N-acetyltransferase